MEKKKKPRPQYILDALMTGKSLRATDIQKMVSDASGEEIKIQDITSLIAKLRNAGTFQLAHFINRNKTPHGYIYNLVPEILHLTSEEIYGLTLKIGKDRFTLKMAIEKVPELRQYVKKVTKEKTVLKVEPELTGSDTQNVPVEGVFSILLNEIEKIGLKVNFNFSVFSCIFKIMAYDSN